jgi:hypothetical protein
METQVNQETKKSICELEGCKRKLKLTELTTPCKCSKAFCMKHRHAEEHRCTFNYREKGLLDLSKTLVKIQAEKLEII